MKLLLRLALRNVIRHRSRSLLSGSVIFFGVFFLICARGFVDGLEYGSEETQIATNCAHLRVMPTEVNDDGFDLPLEPRIVDTAPILESARRLDHVVGVTPRIRFSGEVSDGRSSLRVLAIGVDPTSDGEVFDLGAPPTTDGVVLGSGIMELFELTPGDAITLVARTPEGSISALDYVVRGALSTGNPAVDNLHVLVPIDSARRLLALDSSDSTEIAVRLDHRRHTEAVRSGLAQALPSGISARSWVDATEDIRALMTVRRRAIGIIVVVIMGIAAAGIANTILMSIYERFREIGTLAAFGFPGTWLRGMFLTEGIVLGTLGSLGGVFAGAVTVSYFERHGIDITSLTNQPDVVYPVASIIYLELSAAGLAQAGLFGILASGLATLLPARRAATLDPVEALRG